MIVSLYRTNQGTILLSLPVAGALLWTLFFLSDASFFSPPDSAWSVPLIPLPWEETANILALKIAGLLLSIGQGIFFTLLLQRAELFDRQTYVPAFCWVFFSAVFFPSGMLNPTGIALFFVLGMLYYLLKVYRQTHSKSEIFNAGFCMGMAVLFCWPLIGLLAFSWIAITIQKAFYLRERVLGFIAMLIPLLFAETWYFVRDGEWFVPSFPDWENAVSPLKWLPGSRLQLLALGLLLLLMLLSAVVFLMRLRGTVIKVRRQRQLLFLLTLISLVIFAATACYYPEAALPILVLPCSIFISFCLTHCSFRWLSDLLFHVLIILCILVWLQSSSLINL